MFLPQKTLHALGLATFAWLSAGDAMALNTADYAVQVSAVVTSGQAGLKLTWVRPSSAPQYYRVYRRTPGDAAFGAVLADLPATALEWSDPDVPVGKAYEYKIETELPNRFGVVFAGIDLPLVDRRGVVVLVVAKSQATALAKELERLERDLSGDGWSVIRHDVDENISMPPLVKKLVVDDYAADPTHVRAVFLFGHVPVPYSGSINPDGHPDHLGAWPADLYYGDVNGVWTDTTQSATSANGVRADTNYNIPGDGKFDQSTVPDGTVELEVGRVDLYDLPSFAMGDAGAHDETFLLRRYLDKDHTFRQAGLSVARRGFVDDRTFKEFGGEAFSANGWRAFSAMFGPGKTVNGSWFSGLASSDYLFAYACGPGGIDSMGGPGTTADFAANDPRVVFTMLFGSYFGDWDSTDNFLRAPLATPTYTLTSAWAGRPNWFFHEMALGAEIGTSARTTQNNTTELNGGMGAGMIHVALMGDPTLRMHPVGPPSHVTLSGATLSWTASTDAVLGYHVYRGSSTAGPFERATTDLVTGTSFTDPSLAAMYMVRAVKLEQSGGGTYYNASQGAFLGIDEFAVNGKDAGSDAAPEDAAPDDRTVEASGDAAEVPPSVDQPADEELPAGQETGCSCRASGRSPPAGLWVLAGLAVGLAPHRRVTKGGGCRRSRA